MKKQISPMVAVVLIIIVVVVIALVGWKFLSKKSGAGAEAEGPKTPQEQEALMRSHGMGGPPGQGSGAGGGQPGGAAAGGRPEAAPETDTDE